MLRNALYAGVCAWVCSVLLTVSVASAAEPAACLSPSPADWPEPAKPYFLVIADTSTSMSTATTTANACGYPQTRTGMLSCALKTSFQNLSGLARFGLMTFASKQSACSGACYQGCAVTSFAADSSGQGCGPEPTPTATNSASRAGGNLVVPLAAQGPNPLNIQQLLTWVDNACTNSQELYSVGNTPLNGALRDAFRYFSGSWTSPDGSPTYMTPLASDVNACRRLNVILLVDGDETCDGPLDVLDAAADLFGGFTYGGIYWKVNVYVVNLTGSLDPTRANAIAAAGGTTTSYTANDDAALVTAMNAIVTASLGGGETCDNSDNNCNGCTDEGFGHYGNIQPIATDCCSWSTKAQRTTCLSNYVATITVLNPTGNTKLLPCTTAAQGVDPATWLCFNPGERCDNVDNNLVSGVDEGVLKCGNPLHCPNPEVCNGLDDDCDGLIDDGVCSGCSYSQEVCDGCDNDCDGVADDGIANTPCGLSQPANCAGQRACVSKPVGFPGACVGGGGWGQCTNNPQPEVCDNIDNDCDSMTDEGVAATPCVPAGTPGGLVYGGTSQCKQGQKPCGSSICVGFVGPSTEVCDGIDNDCDGQADENAFGVGVPCGINQPPCTPGLSACVNGALICQGGVGPQAEVCDGLDNNCNGVIDDAPLADAPAAGQSGCWDNPGNCCSYNNVTWCPPPGASCGGLGVLSSPCSAGKLECVSGYYQCMKPVGPSPEICNGLDDNCNGAPDDGWMPQTGSSCGSDVGECVRGLIACSSGVLDCDLDVPPSPEVCDGMDNDCDGVTDNGVSSGIPCTPAYDTNFYPGERTQGPCKTGFLSCDGMMGQVCLGGVGPAPEVCDGIDNDCDGLTDEDAPAPEGIQGTFTAVPGVVMGEFCFAALGGCVDSVWICKEGQPYCPINVEAERCDGVDNDCDGMVDETPSPNEPILCGAGSECVRHDSVVRCAQPCTQTLPVCPGGQECVDVVSSFDDSPLPDGCLPRNLLVAPAFVSSPVMEMSGKQPGKVALPSGLSRTVVGVPQRVVPVELAKKPALLSEESVRTAQEPAELLEAAVQSKKTGPGDEPELGTQEPETQMMPLEAQPATSGCSAGAQSSKSASGLTLLMILSLGLMFGIRRRHQKVLVLSALLLAFTVACTVETKVDPVDVGDTSTLDSAHDGVLPDVTPLDVKEPNDKTSGDVLDVNPGDADGVAQDTDGVSADTLDAKDQEPQDGLDVLEDACSEADLKSPKTCGACDHNCLDEVPANSNGEMAVCEWDAGNDEPGVCLFPACLPGWSNPDPSVPGCEYFCTASLTPEDLCNGVDDDCDKQTDEDVDACAVATCGGCDAGKACVADFVAQANCVASGVSCDDAVCEVAECTEGHVDLDKTFETGCEYPCLATSDLEGVCDGLDDDCNGDVDEVFDFYSPFHCGGCHVNCYELLPNSDVETVKCSWSGDPQDAGVCSFTTCAVNYHDLDPVAPACETYCVKQADLDTTCNDADDDCDGKVDEDVDLCSVAHCGDCDTSCSMGPSVMAVGCQDRLGNSCTSGAQCAITECEAGYVDLDKETASGCEYACVSTGPEMCDGLDNDCNGMVDEDLSMDPTVGAVCYGSPLGTCGAPEHAGITECSVGMVLCTGANVLTEGAVGELCNGLDDNCNGVVDDYPGDVGSACGVSNIFPCHLGTQQCQNGAKVCKGAVNPGIETCNGFDDDCDGVIDIAGDSPPADSVGVCNVPIPAPAGATSPCTAGSKACQVGMVQCVGSTGPTSTVDSCGVDANCDGALTNQPNVMSDVSNCGSCNNNCYTGSVHAIWGCNTGICQFQGCEFGYYDLDGNSKCEYACTYISSQEICNGTDDNCNGQIDEAVIKPTPTQVCGVSPAALTAECTSQVSVACQAGAWKCTFAAGVCPGGCDSADEICDALDNDCDGVVNENVSNYGQPCSSDDGMPLPGHGACRTTGTFICNGTTAVACSATKADCSTLPGGCTELCDGVDNDCDGLVDEAFSSKGTNTANFVKPVVTKIGASLWIYTYEASRHNATSLTAGSGNGYRTSAPAGATLDKTASCSVPSKMPWFNVTAAEATQTCTAMGGRLCTASEWRTACQTSGTTTCTYGYNPRGTACTSSYTASKFCNMGPTYDFNPLAPFDQDGLLATASALLQNCWADWSALNGNTASTNKLYDITGNLGELVSDGTSLYPIMGGTYLTESEASAACTNTTLSVANTYAGAQVGFRCCFASDPTL